MNRIDALVRQYEQFVSLPWERGLPSSQRIWFAVYDKQDERRLRARVGEFELATKKVGHAWDVVDLTDTFAQWMATNDYREEYFAEPEYLDQMALRNFESSVQGLVQRALRKPDAGEGSIVAVLGVACLFGFVKVSKLVKDVEGTVRGRLLVFFPGEHEDKNYRLLDARDGWNYMAVPITAHRSGVGHAC